MRVLAVDHVGGIGVFREKYRALAKDPDVDLTVFVPETWIENGRVVAARPGGDGYRLLTGRAGFRGYENRAFFYSGLARAVREAKPDILHLAEEPFSVIALESVLAAGLLSRDSKALFYTFDNLREGFRYPYRPSIGYGLIQRFVQGRVHCGVASCSEAGRVLRSRGFSKPVRFVPLGVDPERFCRRNASVRSAASRTGDLVIGFVGRLVAAKGVHVLLDALQKLPFASCLIIGDGPERPAIERFVEERGLRERVRLETHVLHGEVPEYLNLMDVLVLPSLTTPKWKEQFGRVLIEAMACEVPVIGSTSGAIPEVIGEAGLLFPEGDAGALAVRLEELARNRARRDELATAGRARVLRHFTWSRIAEKYRTIYNGLSAGSLASEEEPEWNTSS